MIKLVIFDWAGTTIDYGCFAPVEAFRKAFNNYKLEVSTEEIRKPMGLLKIEHIKTMLEMPRINNLFKEKYQRTYNEEDIKKINSLFEEELFKSLKDYTKPIKGVIELVNELKEKKINIGSTTGYTSEMMEVVASNAKIQGYSPDFLSTAQTAKEGRPSSKMIEENMNFFKVSNTKQVIKVGDTITDIKEGLNANVITVGVILGSSELGKSENEKVSLEEKEMIRQKFLNAGANYVIDEIYDLIYLIDKLNLESTH